MAASQEEQILDLKRRAMAAKENGDTNLAMQLLGQARDIEFENARVEDFWEPLKLKQLAVVFKKKGDLVSAKQALLKAKQIEKEGVQAVQDQQQQQQQQEPPTESAELAVPPAAPPVVAEEPTIKAEPVAQTPDKEFTEAQTPDKEVTTAIHTATATVTAAPTADDDDVVEVDDDELKELMQLNDEKGDDEHLLANVSFTMEEMADHEMMTEFKLGGMPVPTDDDYLAKILECKKAALVAKKTGDTASALQSLQKSKLLEKVRVALSQVSEGGVDMNDDDAAMMNDLTFNDEDNALLGELMVGDKPSASVIIENSNSAESDIETTLEELADFLDDPAMLKEAMDMGMEIPSVEEVRAKADEAKQTAISNKKADNLEGAKTALLKSKKLMAHAAKLEAALAQIPQNNGNGSDGKNVNMEDLEALLEAEDKGSKKASAAIKKPVQVKPPVPAVKSSDELKQEAIQLRDAKKIREAAEKLKQYKDTLKREQNEAEVKKRQNIIKAIQKEVDYAQRQMRIFEFYDKFVEGDAPQVSLWEDYITRCTNVIKVVQLKGSGAVKITRKEGSLVCAKQEGQEDGDINAVVKSLVDAGSNSDSSDERLEIHIIDVFNLQKNTNLQKLAKQQKREKLTEYPATIRIDVHLQLPPNAEETDKSTELVFDPLDDPLEKLKLATEGQQAPQLLPHSYDIQSSQYVELVRGTSPHGKLIRRRIERNKKIQITAHSVPIAPKKGWFWSKKNKTDEALPPPTLLGKIVLELGSLMTGKCAAAGEFAFMNGSGSKALGGVVRLVVRTGVPFGEPEVKAEAAIDEAPAEVLPYNAMAFSTPAAEI